MSLFGNLFGFSSNKSSSTTNYNFQQRSVAQEKELAKYTNALYQASENALLSNSAKATIDTNKQLMQYQYALERQSRQTSYGDTRKDLESAGYNPLLAIGQQSNYTPVSSGVQANDAETQDVANANLRANTMSSVLGTATSAYSAYNQATNLTKQTASNILSSNFANDLNSARTELTRSQAVGQDIQNAIQNATGLKQAIANLDLTNFQKNKLSQDIAESQSNILRNSALAEESRSRKLLNEQQAQTQGHYASYMNRHPWINTVKNLISGGNGVGSSLMGLIQMIK